MYLLSVVMFSFYVLVNKSPAHTAIKWIMFVMVFSLALDEIRQVASSLLKMKNAIYHEKF